MRTPTQMSRCSWGEKGMWCLHSDQHCCSTSIVIIALCQYQDPSWTPLDQHRNYREAIRARLAFEPLCRERDWVQRWGCALGHWARSPKCSAQALSNSQYINLQDTERQSTVSESFWSDTLLSMSATFFRIETTNRNSLSLHIINLSGIQSPE